jgi:hypothetical protein
MNALTTEIKRQIHENDEINYCSICGCSLIDINLNIDHIKYLNWNGETVYLCKNCLECIKYLI